jgi:hypothetical protein
MARIIVYIVEALAALRRTGRAPLGRTPGGPPWTRAARRPRAGEGLVLHATLRAPAEVIDTPGAVLLPRAGDPASQPFATGH